MCIGGESYEAEALLIPAQRDARGLAIPPSAAAWAAAAAAIALHDEATCVSTTTWWMRKTKRESGAADCLSAFVGNPGRDSPPTDGRPSSRVSPMCWALSGLV